MGLNPHHLRDLVVRPALEQVGLWSLAAEQLVMGTAAQESNLRHLAQVGGGPALGLWQMEPDTHEDIWCNFLRFRADLRARICTTIAGWPIGSAALVTNLAYAAAMCRLKYLRDPEPLPAAGNVPGMAATWKRVYNTAKGKGRPEEFIRNWRLVEDLYP